MLKESASDKKAWKPFSMFIRLRDAIQTTGGIDFIKCCTCQKIKPFSEFDCGHYMRRDYQNTKYDEKNNHAQCTACNREREGEHNAYRYFMQKMYREEFTLQMETKAKKIKQYMDFELEELAEVYKEKVEKLMKSIKHNIKE